MNAPIHFRFSTRKIFFVLTVSFFSTFFQFSACNNNSEKLSAENYFRGEQIAELRGHTKGIKGLCVTPDNQKIISCSADGTIRIWDSTTLNCLFICKTRLGYWVNSICLTPDGQNIVAGYADKMIRIWDCGTGNLLLEFGGHTDVINAVCITPDGKQVISASDDKTICVWDSATGALLRQYVGHSEGVSCLCISTDGKTIISGSYDKTVRIWDRETGRQEGVLFGHTHFVVSVCITPDGQTIISADSYTSNIRIWDRLSHQELRQCNLAQIGGAVMCLTDDGTKLVAGMVKTVRIWDVLEAKLLMSFPAKHIDTILAICIMPNGKRIITGSWDNTIRIWE